MTTSPRTIRLELHCHTVSSKDGLMNPAAVVRVARRVGLDAVAITDHDSIEGAQELERLVARERIPLRVIVGEERTLADGSHLIGLFLKEPIQAVELEAAIDEIRQQNGLCLIPHPFRRKDGLLREDVGRLKCFEGRPAAFELFSAKSSAEDNRKARGLLATHLAPFGGSDAHYDSDLGESMNVITWTGDLRDSIEKMFRRETPFQILGRVQKQNETERAYAPVYYRCRKFVRLPGSLLPLAKSCYRWYRSVRYGVGQKPLMEVYAHS